MSAGVNAILKRGAAAGIMALVLLGCPTASTAPNHPLFIAIGESTRAPIGWVEFCLDGYGDCEDYVLEKRRVLLRAGWPREALLITVVRDLNGDGHAVLTVTTDKGEFILDNQRDDILLWSDTGYRFVKRQTQSDPNVWVSLGEPRAARHRHLALSAPN